MALWLVRVGSRALRVLGLPLLLCAILGLWGPWMRSDMQAMGLPGGSNPSQVIGCSPTQAAEDLSVHHQYAASLRHRMSVAHALARERYELVQAVTQTMDCGSLLDKAERGGRYPERKGISVPVRKQTLDVTERGAHPGREDKPRVMVGPDALRAPSESKTSMPVVRDVRRPRCSRMSYICPT